MTIGPPTAPYWRIAANVPHGHLDRGVGVVRKKQGYV